jgi:hypothetical protein
MGNGIYCLACGGSGWSRKVVFGPVSLAWGRARHQPVNTVHCPRRSFFLEGSIGGLHISFN